MKHHGHRKGTFRTLVALGLLAAVVAGVLGFGGVYVWVWAPIALFLYTLTAAVIVRCLRRGLALPWDNLGWPMLAFAGVVAAQWLLGRSQDPAAAQSGLVELGMLGCASFLGWWVFRSATPISRAATIIWAFTGALAAEAICQHFTAAGWIYWIHDARYATPTGPYVYHNHYAGCIDLLLPVAAAVAISRRGDGIAGAVTRAGWALAPLLGAASVVVALSRGGVLVLVGEAALAAALFWRPSAKSTRGLPLAAVIALCGAIAVNWGPLAARMAQLEHHDPSAVDRVRAAEACLAIFRAHPGLGIGFGAFPVAYPAYELFDNSLTWDQAHNEYAQTLAETGLAGTLAVAAFLVLLGLGAARSLHENPPSIARLQRASLIGLIGFLCHSAIDFQFHAPGNALLFFVLCAFTVARVPRQSRPATNGPNALHLSVHAPAGGQLGPGNA